MAYAVGSAHVPVDSRVYKELELLEAEGLIKSGLLDSRPLSRSEAARLIKEAAASISGTRRTDRVLKRLQEEFSGELGKRQGSYFKPLESVSAKYVFSEDVPYFYNYNNKGDRFDEGSNFRLGAVSHARLGNALSFYFNPELRYPSGIPEGVDLEIVEAYASLTFLNIEVTGGRESLWWGPGRHGALLLSSNPKPFDLVKITNPEPFSLPLLGWTRLTVFATRLEEDRDIPNPYLAGLRLDIKPHQILQIGFSRTAMFGGEGRDVDLGTVWDVFTAGNENTPEEPGNQLGAIDAKLVLPFEAQPVVIYGELGGEDEAGGLPSRIGYIAGLFLPRVLSIENLELRAEYANDYIPQYPNIWYSHHLYTDGYAYMDRVIGHHMGADSRDLFMELSYDADRLGNFAFLIDFEVTKAANTEKHKTAGLSWAKDFKEHSTLRLQYVFDDVLNAGGVKGMDSQTHSFSTNLEIQL